MDLIAKDPRFCPVISSLKGFNIAIRLTVEPEHVLGDPCLELPAILLKLRI